MKSEISYKSTIVLYTQDRVELLPWLCNNIGDTREPEDYESFGMFGHGWHYAASWDPREHERDKIRIAIRFSEEVSDEKILMFALKFS